MLGDTMGLPTLSLQAVNYIMQFDKYARLLVSCKLHKCMQGSIQFYATWIPSLQSLCYKALTLASTCIFKHISKLFYFFFLSDQGKDDARKFKKILALSLLWTSRYQCVLHHTCIKHPCMILKTFSVMYLIYKWHC